MYTLIRTPPDRVVAPELDAYQRKVVDHPHGPLLVLAGPGTGKTTTLVESVVDRIERRGLRADQILVLTFSRRAAADLRARIAGRLGRSVVTPMVFTFHAFCHALVRRFADPESVPTMRLLTAPEQEFRLRELLEGSRAGWPDSLAPAFGTRAFAGEVRAVLAKARQLGMDPEDLEAAGEAAERPEWQAIGAFFDEYLDVLDAEQVLDYAELVHRSRILLADPTVVDQLRAELAAVFVDEYQDTDPAQVRLLQAVAGDGRDVVVVGDPDQSVYAFRGAEARGILDFPTDFPTTSGAPAPTLALGTTRRFGTALLAASRNVAGRLSLPRALPAAVLTTYRNPVAAAGVPRGRVEALTCSTAGAEAEQIADLLREAHLREGVPWSQMAVLVRSGKRMIPGLNRALAAAEIPVEVAGDEIPLAGEPAVRPLLLGLQVALRGATIDGVRPDPDEARVLLGSPLGGLDSMALRRLGRGLRQAHRAELAGTGLPRPSAVLVAEALAHPDLLDDLPAGPETDGARRVATLLSTCGSAIRSGATAEEALWGLWSGTGWPERLRRQAALTGEAARRANRDLDAACALFDIATRSDEVVGRRGIAGFLAEVEGQQIPADTMREADTRGAAVRLLTAHRAKGLEWDLVVVAGVQEGAWPDVRRRGSLLEPDRLSRGGLSELPPTSARIAEERRLFYVACTRARRRLVVTAVAGTEGEGDEPSRFLTELGVPVRSSPGRPDRALTFSALVAQLRRTATDPEAVPSLREAAAARLAKLTSLTDARGAPLVPAADPTRWWGTAALTASDRPVVRREQSVRLSGSQLGGVLACPRQWFLAREARGETIRNPAATFGSVVHVLAEYGAATGGDGLSDHLDQVWDQLNFDAKWLSAVERIEAESAVERFLAWQEANTDRELLGTEASFACDVALGGERVHLTGTADRVERDPDGRIRIVDFKTGRSEPRAADVAVQDQLGAYQLAVAAGAFEEVAGPDARPGGAELVYLRLPDAGGPLPKVFSQASLDDVPFPVADESQIDAELAAQPTWVHRRLLQAARLIREERFDARVGPACRYCPFRGSCPAQPTGRQVVA